MHPRNFSDRETPLSQLGRPLTEAEISGSLSREIGLLPARRLQPSVTTTSQRDPRHVAYVHPPLRSAAPQPSSLRPAPRRPETCA